MFRAIKILSAYPTYLRFRLSCNFLGDFWAYLKLKIDRRTLQFQGLSLHFIPDLYADQQIKRCPVEPATAERWPF